MWTFLLICFGVYGAMHAYFFLKWRAAFPRRRSFSLPLALFLLLMMVVPILVRALERAGYPGAAGALASIGHPWIAVLFWFCGLALVVDFWNMTCGALSLVIRRARRLVMPWRAAFPAAAVIIAAASVWAVREAGDLRTVEVVLRTDRLLPGSKPIRMAQISDLHLDVRRGDAVAARVVAQVRAMNPDVLVCTGDLADTAFRYVRRLADVFRALEPPLGKYAVLGNHEYYVGLDNSVAFLHASGFSVLRGESVQVSPRLRLAGVDDPAGHFQGQPCFTDTPRSERAGEGVFNVLLKHQPVVDPASAERFDLQLSGHTHGGQIFPFQILLWLMYPFPPGLHRLGERFQLYVSRGVGTWGPPMRLFAPPEVTLLVVEPLAKPAVR